MADALKDHGELGPGRSWGAECFPAKGFGKVRSQQSKLLFDGNWE